MYDPSTSAVLVALGVTLAAGLATGLGSLLVIFARGPNPRLLAFGLAFAGGAMVYVSLTEIFTKSVVSFTQAYDARLGFTYATFAFLAGVLLIMVIDMLVPNPHDTLTTDDPSLRQHNREYIRRVGLMTAVAITAHNFPEGLATFFATLGNPGVGMPLAFAIAIHNIPEGIAVSVPIYFATRSHKRAFLYSFASGLAEPIGALVGFFLLSSFFTAATFGIVFALIAGIMVYVSLDELLPTAEEYGEHHLAIGGLVGGMAVMGVSLVLFL